MELKYSAIYLYSFLNLALNGGESSALHPGRFTPVEKARSHILYKKLCGPHSNPECFEENNFLPLPGFEPGIVRSVD
jgi:hypothetical protein